MKIYLAGAISLKHESFCRGWRQNMQKKFEEVGIKVVNPIEGKDLRKRYDPRDIVETDLESINNCDLVLAEMDLNCRAYVGTSMEIRHAWSRYIPVIVWGTANQDNYFLQYHVDKFFDSKKEVEDYIISKFENSNLIVQSTSKEDRNENVK